MLQTKHGNHFYKISLSTEEEPKENLCVAF